MKWLVAIVQRRFRLQSEHGAWYLIVMWSVLCAIALAVGWRRADEGPWYDVVYTFPFLLLAGYVTLLLARDRLSILSKPYKPALATVIAEAKRASPTHPHAPCPCPLCDMASEIPPAQGPDDRSGGHP